MPEFTPRVMTGSKAVSAQDCCASQLTQMREERSDARRPVRVVVSKLPVKLLAIAFGGRLLRFGARAPRPPPEPRTR